NDWLITPLLSLPAGEEIEFSLWAKSYNPDYLESFEILISTDGGENFTNVGSQTDISSTYTKYTFDLSNYAGQNVYIAIVCTSINKWYLFVDDISCAVKETTSSSIVIDESYLEAYPNPFTSKLILESKRGISQVSVMNISGQVVLAKQANGELKLVLETSNLKTGLYIIKVTGIDGSVLHTRVVKHNN
ncbi:MAG: T9SS type A sorting domain-containing protein, partial [Bacteroidales bacterium]|nr:T9SS type A sorting domain-containing protein [Bacteroidales bacterium]